MTVRVACAGAWKWAFLGLAAIVLLLGVQALAGHAVQWRLLQEFVP